MTLKDLVEQTAVKEVELDLISGKVERTKQKAMYTKADAERFYYKMKQEPRPKAIPKPQANKARKYITKQCRLCDVTSGLEVHHIIPVSIGGYTTDLNSLTLCADCHLKITKYYNYIGLMKHRVERSTREVRG